ncbi:MAG: glycosyltransferase family 2 protein [Phormidesmis sp. RL_2_1]|nr:glycosyltransferase family 2 protein [Phormidesmis sp. RL_2_1]
MVKVSVIIPNYNRAAIVGDTVENMLRQSLAPHEVIVVDDGSTDDSVAVLRCFGDRIILLQQPNQGPGAARNAGLNLATGEFIQFMDSDDLSSLNKLEVQAQTLIKHSADMVYGPWLKAWMDNRCIRLENVVLQQRPLPASRHPLHWFLTRWSMVFQQCLIRRTALIRVGGYRKDMRLYEDGDLFVRLLLSGATLVHEAESLTFYRLENYGKLTACGRKNNGAQSDLQAKDTARFYSSVIQQLQAHPQFEAILSDIDFRSRVWQSWHRAGSVTSLAVDGTSEIKRLEAYGNENKLRLWAWLQQKQKGLQQRLQGHRWPRCYQSGKLSDRQQHLIQAMGLSC